MKTLFEHIDNNEPAQFQQVIKEQVEEKLAVRLAEIKQEVAADLFGLEINDEEEEEV